MVQRGEAPGDMVGLVVGRRRGGHQTDVLGDRRQRREQGERLERGHRVAALQRFDRHVEHRQVVGHEEGVELARLQLRDEALHVAEVEIGVRKGARIAPGAGVDADRPHEGAQLQLLTWWTQLHLSAADGHVASKEPGSGRTMGVSTIERARKLADKIRCELASSPTPAIRGATLGDRARPRPRFRRTRCQTTFATWLMPNGQGCRCRDWRNAGVPARRSPRAIAGPQITACQTAASPWRRRRRRP